MDERSAMQHLIERTQIIDVVVGIANAIDQKNWAKLRKYLADEIAIDYSDFRGELPRSITADEYVKQRIDGLANLKTLHISTNHEVTLQDNDAECRSAYRIYRVDPNREPGEDRLDTAGNYVHHLVQSKGAWRVIAIQQTVVMLSGNSLVHGAFRNSS